MNAWDTDLSLISAFFVSPYKTPVVELAPPAQTWILSEASLVLRALGRLMEALLGARENLRQTKKRKIG